MKTCLEYSITKKKFPGGGKYKIRFYLDSKNKVQIIAYTKNEDDFRGGWN